MDVFLFIIILVAIVTFGEVATKVGIPLTRKLGELIGEGVGGKREGAAIPSPELAEAMESLENRLARIEDRLDFLEELKAAPEQRALRGAEPPEPPA